MKKNKLTAILLITSLAVTFTACHHMHISSASSSPIQSTGYGKSYLRSTSASVSTSVSKVSSSTAKTQAVSEDKPKSNTKAPASTITTTNVNSTPMSSPSPALALPQTVEADTSHPQDKNEGTANSDLVTMKVRSFTDDELVLESTLSEGRTLLTTFDKKSWGTWNIGSWLIQESDNEPQLIAGGGTDWEYVLCAGTPEDGTSFCGGNHNNEKLKSISITDTSTGLPIISSSKNISSITIEEFTSLCFDQTSNEFANVRRVYKISPGLITLSTKFSFIRNTCINTSYLCMLPVIKGYGRYINFVDNNTIYTLPPSGQTLTTSTFSNYYGNLETNSVEAYGDADRNVKLKVWIDKLSIPDETANKLNVFAWDLNTSCNKIYFSKFSWDITSTVKSGTIWENSEGWSIQYTR